VPIHRMLGKSLMSDVQSRTAVEKGVLETQVEVEVSVLSAQQVV
jgi:hypothetical protein